MRPKTDCRSIANATADNAVSFVLLADPEQRDDAIASCAEGFRDACIQYGVSVEPGDLAYYVRIVSAKVAEIGASVQSEKFN